MAEHETSTPFVLGEKLRADLYKQIRRLNAERCIAVSVGRKQEIEKQIGAITG